MRISRAGLVTAAFLIAFMAVRPGARVTASASMRDLPLSAGDMRADQASQAAPDVARTLGADEYIYRVYRQDTAAVEMDVAYYRDPRVGRVMHSPLNCLPGNGWQLSGLQTLAIADNWQARSLVAERGTTRLALMYWYQTPRHVTGNEFVSRMHLLFDAVRAGRRDSTLVRLVMPLSGSPTEATATLSAFASQLIPQIATRLN
jgi:EpsI family protein